VTSLQRPLASTLAITYQENTMIQFGAAIAADNAAWKGAELQHPAEQGS